MRKLLRLATIGLVLLVAVYAYLAWQNNRPADYPTRAQVEAALEKGIQWLQANRTKILETGNPILWYMVQQSAEITADSRLQGLFSDYKTRYLDGRRSNIWRPLFFPDSWVGLRFDDIRSLPYYNWYFLYAITCDDDLASVAQIAEQNDPAFCDQHPLKPACVTHQMMGIRLLQRKACGDKAVLSRTARSLQQRIRQQLVLDPRVVDVYLQRLLMLLESGAPELVKPVWIQRIINAQLEDGGWDNSEPLIPVGGSRYIAFSSRGISIEKHHSNFHTSAQGVLIFAILTNTDQEDSTASVYLTN